MCGSVCLTARMCESGMPQNTNATSTSFASHFSSLRGNLNICVAQHMTHRWMKVHKEHPEMNRENAVHLQHTIYGCHTNWTGQRASMCHTAINHNGNHYFNRSNWFETFFCHFDLSCQFCFVLLILLLLFFFLLVFVFIDYIDVSIGIGTHNVTESELRVASAFVRAYRMSVYSSSIPL